MSKANQAFKQNDEAVSPVIGVILMVAITVVLAAVVFVLVSNLGKGSEKAPNVTFNKDSSALTLTVVTSETADWRDFSWTPAAGGVCQAELTTSDGVVADEEDLSSIAAQQNVRAGDVVAFIETASGDCDGVTFRLVHEPTNSQVYETTF